jgi:hypothetical protein
MYPIDQGFSFPVVLESSVGRRVILLGATLIVIEGGHMTVTVGDPFEVTVNKVSVEEMLQTVASAFIGAVKIGSG